MKPKDIENIIEKTAELYEQECTVEFSEPIDKYTIIETQDNTFIKTIKSTYMYIKIKLEYFLTKLIKYKKSDATVEPSVDETPDGYFQMKN
jgi:hypothetical protein